jgi:D-alanyl-lipoteichoic acid acyltransferase DltB (MBOAT superfamily)
MVTMVLGGLWHGAAWNFVVWGVYHGSLLALHRWISERRSRPSKAPEILKLVSTFAITVFGFFIFRVESAGQFWAISSNVISNFTWTDNAAFYLVPVLSCFGMTCLYQTLQERLGGDPDQSVLTAPGMAFAVSFLTLSVIAVGFRPTPFVYFQF